MERIDVEGLGVAYVRAGEGEPVVLLHGYVGDAVATWRHQLDGLGDDFTVVAWDAPGMGASDDPPESLGIAGYADCLARFVHALGFDRVHLVGLSFGGALAIELHRRHPSVTRTLVLVSAYAGWRGSLPAPVAEARLQQALRLSGLPPSEFVATLLPTMFATPVAGEDRDRFRTSMEAFHPAGFRAMARASASDLRDALPGIRVPTLLVYGDADVRAPLEVAERLHRAIASSELVVLPGVGHLCNVEAPAAFNRVVRSFLAAQRA